MIIVALYQIKHHGVEHVVIITCNAWLLIQLKKDISDLLPIQYRGKILALDSSSEALSFPKGGVVLIDEYDKTLENLVNVMKVKLNDFKLSGLAQIRFAPRIIVFSATANESWTPILNLLGISGPYKS